MKNLTKFCFLKVPKTISFFYFKKRNLIIFKSFRKKRFVKINPKLTFLVIKDKILVFVNSVEKLSTAKIKFFNSLKNIIVSCFKELLTETELNFFGKLQLIGVGFKILETTYNNILMLKLGYSHSIYIKLNLKVELLKNIKLLVKSDSYITAKRLLSKIRLLKLPEPYKGKGIFFNKEKISLKDGKKN